MKRGLDPSEFEQVVKILANGDPVPEKYRDHPLANTVDYQECRELHIKADWLLV